MEKMTAKSIDVQRKILGILIEELAKGKTQLRNSEILMLNGKRRKGGKGFKICKNDRVRISGPVKYGETTPRVNSEALVLATTKRRILATIDSIDGDGNVTLWVSRKCVYAA